MTRVYSNKLEYSLKAEVKDHLGRKHDDVILRAVRTKEQNFPEIKRMTTKVNLMDLLKVIELSTNSCKQVAILTTMLGAMDTEHQFVFSKAWCERNSVNYQVASTIIKRLIDIGAYLRIKRGTYLVNPYILNKSYSTAEQIEDRQAVWKELGGFIPEGRGAQISYLSEAHIDTSKE